MSCLFDCAIIVAHWLTNGSLAFGFADFAVTRDGARGRWLGYIVALPGQTRSVPVQVAASIIGCGSHHDAHESDDEWH